MYNVAIYLMDKAYGGPEEGGWWYDTEEVSRASKHLEHARLFRDERMEDAYEYARTLNKRYDEEWNEGRPEISSVTSIGRYRALVNKGTVPKNYPTRRPRYE